MSEDEGHQDRRKPLTMFLPYPADKNEEWLSLLRKVVNDAARTDNGPTTMLNLATTGDAWLRGVDVLPAAYRPRLVNLLTALATEHAPASTVANAGLPVATGQAAAPTAVAGSPAAEKQGIDYLFWGAVLLCVIAWLVYFVGPHLISESRQPTSPL